MKSHDESNLIRTESFQNFDIQANPIHNTKEHLKQELNSKIINNI